MSINHARSVAGIAALSVAAALATYALIRSETMLPLVLTVPHFAAVLVAALVMAAASAFLSMSNLRRADPADVF